MCNGEIYNYKVLAEKYDITLETESDCMKLFFIYTINQLLIFLLMNYYKKCFLLVDLSENKIIIGHILY